MFSKISLPVPSQQMTRFFGSVLCTCSLGPSGKCYPGEYSGITRRRGDDGAQLKLDAAPPKPNANGHGLGISWENLDHDQ
ncbi:hypothetical protein GGD63_007133 [Bradyrhizobium sp. cir1]|nr:hypothetical protein [Bradyrhizobium sp. cir1]